MLYDPIGCRDGDLCMCAKLGDDRSNLSCVMHVYDCCDDVYHDNEKP